MFFGALSSTSLSTPYFSLTPKGVVKGKMLGVLGGGEVFPAMGGTGTFVRNYTIAALAYSIVPSADNEKDGYRTSQRGWLMSMDGHHI